MINIYKKADDSLQEISSIEKDCWINAIQPNFVELNEISKVLDIPEEFLTDPLDIDERPRIEIEDEHILIILRIPFYDKEHPQNPYSTIPLGIVLSEETIITICSIETEIINTFLDRKIKNFSLKNREKFIFLIFLRTAILYLKYLKQISNMTNDFEKELQVSMKNQELIKLMDLEKSLVYFSTSLRANEIMIGRLAASKKFKISSDDRDLLEDVWVEYRQAIEMANVYSNILSSMLNAFSSLISNKLNSVMKFLASVTLVLMLPTLVASIYGMNIPLPMQESPYAFIFTMTISIILAGTAAAIFLRKK
ncbi:MAG TPA: magnesium transporter [Lentisphaeria bacterium]|nr:MAG: magnesium transporter [Lentisphaerae bacterium GWF2_38_69]HBM15059.1 magnesium transporter [Lentisphaeria bacterium]